MDNKKRNIQVERLKEGNTIYRFTASFDGKQTLPEKAVKLIDSEGSV